MIMFNKIRSWFYKEKYNEADNTCVRRILFWKTTRPLTLHDWKKHPLAVSAPAVKHCGRHTYAGSNFFCLLPQETSIGSFCSLGANVQLGHNDHPLQYLSSSSFFYLDALGWKSGDTVSHNEFWHPQPITIGNDVWIGNNVFIKNGITVGDGAVIGASSVVTKNVPPYAIVAGVPAKIIRFRFPDDIIARLQKTKWWELDDSILKTLPYTDVLQTLSLLESRAKEA